MARLPVTSLSSNLTGECGLFHLADNNLEESASDETAATSELPEDSPAIDSFPTEEPSADANPGDDPAPNPEDGAPGAGKPAQEADEGPADVDPSREPIMTEPPVDDAANGGDGVEPKEAEFPPIEPGEGAEGAEADQPELVSHYERW